MSLHPPQAAGGAAAAAVFERATKTAHGTLLLRRYVSDADPSCFEELARVVAIWRSKQSSGALPQWRDFSIQDFVGWHHYLALSDLPGSDGDPRFRIFGSGATDLMGANLTGKRLSEVFPTAAADGVLAHFAALKAGRLIGFLVSNVARPGLEHRSFKVVELPLADDSGAVAQILHAFRDLRGDA